MRQLVTHAAPAPRHPVWLRLANRVARALLLARRTAGRRMVAATEIDLAQRVRDVGEW